MPSNIQQLIITLLQMANPADRWPPKWMLATLQFKDITLLLVPACPGTLVGPQLPSQPMISNPLLKKSPLEQLILHPSSGNFWTWMSPSRLSGIPWEKQASSLLERWKSVFLQGLVGEEHCKHWDLFVEHGVKPVERAWVPVYSAWDTSLWSMGHQSIDHRHQL